MNLDQISPEAKEDIEFNLEQSNELQKDAVCENACPYIFYQEATGTAHIVQGCCNSWTCPRCGHIRARKEYARIVNGAQLIELTAQPLYFWTLTCQGRGISLAQSEADYLKWVNRLLTSVRAKAKRAGQFWCYVQVTERQKRGHPHSHLINSYCPPDAKPYGKGDTLPNGRVARHDCLWSDWFRTANQRAGLGVECDLSLIKTPQAVAVYVAKYLFKQAVNTTWPKGWKRVRYSQSWPKLPKREMLSAFPLIRDGDWQRMEALGLTVHADSELTYYASLARRVYCVVQPIETWSHH